MSHHTRLLFVGIVAGVVLFLLLWATREYSLTPLIMLLGPAFALTPALEGEARAGATLNAIAFGIVPLCLVVGIVLSYVAAALRGRNGEHSRPTRRSR